MKAIDYLLDQVSNGPLQDYPPTLSHGYEVVVKREELNHPIIQGNKWHKLKNNLIAYAKSDKKQIISFGGAFSNHIYSLSGACHILEIPLIIYMRGHSIDADNPTIQQLQKWGVQIKMLDFTSYRNKTNPVFLESLLIRHPDAMIIPEGGSNLLGFEGGVSFAEVLKSELDSKYDYLCIAAGTGASAAAMCKVFENTSTHVLVFSSLKGIDFADIFKNNYNVQSDNWTQVDNYNLNGYGKVNQALVEFISKVHSDSGILLDPIYTSKMFFGIDDMLMNNYFDFNSKICLVHSGGLQGIHGYNYRFGKKYGYLPTK